MQHKHICTIFSVSHIDAHSYQQPGSRRSNGTSAGSSRSYHHGGNAKLATYFGCSPLMDVLMPSNGFTSFSSFSSMSNGGGRTIGGGTNGAVKRTSTSTTFIDGKKLMTKRWTTFPIFDSIFLIRIFHFSSTYFRVYENGKETVFSYENDVLKSKTVNGVAQKLSSITN